MTIAYFLKRTAQRGASGPPVKSRRLQIVYTSAADNKIEKQEWNATCVDLNAAFYDLRKPQVEYNCTSHRFTLYVCVISRWTQMRFDS